MKERIIIYTVLILLCVSTLLFVGIAEENSRISKWTNVGVFIKLNDDVVENQNYNSGFLVGGGFRYELREPIILKKIEFKITHISRGID